MHSQSGREGSRFKKKGTGKASTSVEQKRRGVLTGKKRKKAAFKSGRRAFSKGSRNSVDREQRQMGPRKKEQKGAEKRRKRKRRRGEIITEPENLFAIPEQKKRLKNQTRFTGERIKESGTKVRLGDKIEGRKRGRISKKDGKAKCATGL